MLLHQKRRILRRIKNKKYNLINNMGKKSGKSYTQNDQRSMSKNPNNPAFKAASDNKSNQLNSNNPEYKDKKK